MLIWRVNENEQRDHSITQKLLFHWNSVTNYSFLKLINYEYNWLIGLEKVLIYIEVNNSMLNSNWTRHCDA